MMLLNIFTILVSVTFLATTTFAGFFITQPVGGTRWTAGTNATITWLVEGPISSAKYDITLMFGKAENLDTIATIAKGISNVSGSYTWNVPKELASGALYAICLSSGKDTAYSHFFDIDASQLSSQRELITAISGTNSYSVSGTPSPIRTVTSTSMLSSNSSLVPSSSFSSTYTVAATNTPGLGKIPTMVSGFTTKLNTSVLATFFPVFIISYTYH
ncbi:hypothetical protein K7432_006073 [Basidiobolus ranarum]|uniref:Yeast cell wall synthesis Kre9/Knh1-like N-terminal domain-containing protein n=1 Tax=Basidiobolus ranarum TaxID=34480 RepID=A0ABR2WVI0_9FUNG